MVLPRRFSRLTTEIPQTDFCFDHRKGIPCFKGMPFLLVYSPTKFEVMPLLVPPVLGCLGILSQQFRPDLVVVPLHRGAIHAQLSGDHALAGHAGVLSQVGGNGFLLETYPVRIFRAGPGAQGSDLRLHLEDQLLQLLLALLLRVSVDIPGVLFAVRPDGGVSSLPEVFFDLLEVAGPWPAAGGLDGGELRLRAGGIFFLSSRCRLYARDPLVDTHRRLPPHLVGDVGVGIQGGGR